MKKVKLQCLAVLILGLLTIPLLGEEKKNTGDELMSQLNTISHDMIINMDGTTRPADYHDPMLDKSYTAVPALNWDQLFDYIGERLYPAPITVMYQLHPAFSRNYVFLNRMMTAIRCRAEVCCNGFNLGEARNRETMALQFAFGETPILPDYKKTQLVPQSRKLPLIEAHYRFGHFDWTIEYCNPQIGDNSVLAIRGTVRNSGDSADQAVIWLKQGFHKECGMVPGDGFHTWHYYPTAYDKRVWFPTPENVTFGMGPGFGQICRDGLIIGRVTSPTMRAEWVQNAEFAPETVEAALQKRGLAETTDPSLRLDKVDHVVKFAADLEPGQTASFEWKAMVNYETAEYPEDLNPSFDELHQKAAESFEAVYPKDCAKLEFAQDDWTGIFESMHKGIYQICPYDKRNGWLIPTQGGNGEYHYVWLWEASAMLSPLVRTGHDYVVRKGIDYLFSLQDGGCPPSGRFTSLEGAVGTTGPRWSCTTGAALVLACAYYNYTRDEEYLKEYLPKILRASDWILREIRTTRKLNPDGSRPGWYGLMPFGHGTDDSIGYEVSHTDGNTYIGLKRATELLELIGHPRAAEFRKELGIYYDCIQKAVDQLIDEDGYIHRQFVTGDPEEIVFVGHEGVCGAYTLLANEAADPKDPRFIKHLEVLEEKKNYGLFVGHMNSQYSIAGYGIMYMGIGEHALQRIYLSAGDWKRAFTAFEVNRMYSMTEDTYLLSERFSIHTPDFAPWQPNGSGDGRMIDMILNSFCMETISGEENTLTLLGGIPWKWIEKNKTASLKSLRLFGGTLCDIEVNYLGSGKSELLLNLKGKLLPERFRIPDMFRVTEVQQGMKIDQDRCWTYDRTAAANAGGCQFRFVFENAE